MPTSPFVPPSDPLQHVLDNAEAELRRRLQEACEAEARGLPTDSTQEIRHLEDTLLAAAVAAKQTITVRRHMKRRAPAERERPVKIDDAADRKVNTDSQGHGRPHESVVGTHVEEPVTHVREFTDDTGRAWRAWPVVPGLTRASGSGRRFLGDFQEGWICFEGLDTPARRRFPCRQHSWANVTDEELRRLLAQAIDAPVRLPTRQEKP